jgi:hypothetical protein
VRSLLLVSLFSTFACTSTTGSEGEPVPRLEAGVCFFTDIDHNLCSTPPPSCPEGTDAGILETGDSSCWSGFCIPGAACQQPDVAPGACGVPTTCNIVGPQCPSGTKPGVVDGCWSGFCIPDAVCNGMFEPA